MDYILVFAAGYTVAHFFSAQVNMGVAYVWNAAKSLFAKKS